MRLLLVEPDPRAALWIGEMLRAGWAQPLVIAHAEHLADAVRALSAASTDCIVLDARQLESERAPVVEQLRSAASEVPLVVLGDGLDRGDDGDAIAALRAGAQDYLHKLELHPAQLRRALLHAIERKHAEADLVHRALHDSLTGLPNRALFLDRLRVALDRARRSGTRVAVLFLDVDEFKAINDTHGHAAGDQMLVELADRLRTMLRPMDTVARFGGDEFTFLFEDLSDENEVLLIAERIARACKVPIALEHAEVVATVSTGIAMVGDARTPAETVIRDADAAMYRAKERGGGAYELYDEATRERAQERRELQLELARAIEERQLLVHYQPNFSLQDSSGVIGLEALLRWEHPQRGLLGAEEFIGLAEESGLMLPIGQYVLGEVVRALARWRRQRPDITISINLSPRELEDIGLLSGLAATLRGAEIEPQALCLEVAEQTVARNPTAAARVLRALKDLGVQTAIDDFGTGASSVLALRALPVDTLKLHQSLLDELSGPGGEQAPVIGAVVELAHALGLRVLAEGVETEAQADGLRALGCDRAQGYLFARPLPEQDVSTLLENGSLQVSFP